MPQCNQSCLNDPGATAEAIYSPVMTNIFAYLIPAALVVVLASLCIGVFALFRGGDFGRSWSNRMMRVRVLAQFIAVAVLMAALWWKQTAGQ